MNIKLSYLYRDAANYKNFNDEIFTNIYNLHIEEIEQKVKAQLIEEMHFYVDKWRLKDLHFDKWDNELDHTYHEFDNIEETNEAATQGDISIFLKNIERSNL